VHLVMVELKPGVTPVSPKQYFIPQKVPRSEFKNTLSDS
jgi:hypothetical protein